MKSKYTEELHAERLLKMLDKLPADAVCYSCPANKNFYAAAPCVVSLERDLEECDVCHAFLGMPPADDCDACPCDHFGEEDAIKITVQKLKEKGYM